jgi:hypothetical protein
VLLPRLWATRMLPALDARLRNGFGPRRKTH